MKFYRRVQQSEESIEEYLAELRHMASSCGFCDCMHDVMIMDRILDGHKDPRVKDKLTSQGKLDLQTVLNICRASELTAENWRIVNNQADEYEEIHRVTHKARGDGQGKTKKPPQLCRFCAFKHVLQKEKCPA